MSDATQPTSPVEPQEEEMISSQDTPEETAKKVDLDDEVAASDEVAQTLTSLQNLIERNANELDRLRQELKEHRQSLKNVFDNDATLNEVEQIAQEATVKIKERKQTIDAQPEVRQLKLKIADTREEMKEIEETLNSHLISLFQMTGSQSFDTSDGDQREFTLKAKVMSKGKKSSDKDDT